MSALSHLFMLTSDLSATRRFWVESVGLKVLHEEAAGYLRIGGDGGFHIGIEQGDPGPVNSIEIAVRVPNVNSSYQRLQAAGVATEGPPVDQPWGARHCWLRDPDGRRVSLFS